MPQSQLASVTVAFLLMAIIDAGFSEADAAAAGQQCRPNERRLQPSGLCGKPSVAGCFEAQVPGPTDAAADAMSVASPVRIRIDNKSSSPLYFKAAYGARAISFEIRSAQGQLTPPETLFCPTPCPQAGAVMDVDCGAPVPALIVVQPRASALVDWSGRLAVETARTCGDSAERRCHMMRAARAGRYVVTLCAYPGIENAGPPPSGGETYLPRTRPTGVPRCLDTAFALPAKAPVVVGFR